MEIPGAFLFLCLVPMVLTVDYSWYKIIRIFAGITDVELQFDQIIILKSTPAFFDVAVSNDRASLFVEELQQNNIKFLIQSNNLQYQLNKQKEDVSCDEFSFSQFNTYDVIETYLLSLQNNTGGTFQTDVLALGNTSEGRTIYKVKMSMNNQCQFDTGPKRVILIEGGIHGNEWLSPAVILYFIDYLLNNEQGVYLVKMFDLHIIPVLNPDGYAYTMAPDGDRFWRKNRRLITSEPECYGVDINRNFGFMWDPKNGGSSDPCSKIYSGPHPFSEIESQIERRIMLEAHHFAYLGIHSYGQKWLYPNGFTNVTVSDVDIIAKCGAMAAQAASQTNGITYESGQITDFVPTTGGLAVDYARSASIKYSYEVALRANDTFGFFVPADQIIPTGQETAQAIFKWLECSLDTVNYG